MAELVAKTYSRALFEVGIEQDKLDLFLDELKTITGLFKEYPEYFEILKSPKINTDEKKKVVEQTFSHQSSQEMVNFLKIILDKRRVKDLFGIAKEFEDLIYEHKGMVRAIAVTTTPIDSIEMDLIKEKLYAITGKKVELTNQIDESVLGGVLIKLGDKVIDGTLKGKLNKLNNLLKEIIV